MKRYSNTPVTNRYDGKRVYSTTYYPTIIPADSDVSVVSNEGDYLDTLAFKYYGDPTLWWIIANPNNLGKGRMSVPPGLTLRIPTRVNEIIEQFNRLNARE
jgi:nucleoid-associated protein YgaU